MPTKPTVPLKKAQLSAENRLKAALKRPAAAPTPKPKAKAKATAKAKAAQAKAKSKSRYGEARFFLAVSWPCTRMQAKDTFKSTCACGLNMLWVLPAHTRRYEGDRGDFESAWRQSQACQDVLKTFSPSELKKRRLECYVQS